MKRMIIKPFSIVNVLCNRYKTDPSEVFRVLKHLQKHALVCIHIADDRSITFSKISIGNRYSSDTHDIEEITAGSDLFNVLVRSFVFLEDETEFIDIDNRMIEKLQNLCSELQQQ